LLRTHANWLLIIDNADDLVVAKDFVPQDHGGHVILTTRAQSTGGLAESIQVQSFFKDPEGALLLLRRAKLLMPGASVDSAIANDRTVAEALSAELGGLPLALDQAGAFIEEVPSSLTEYHTLYLREGERLRAERGTTDFGHPSVAVTFSLGFNQVKENTHSETIVSLSAFSGPHDIPEAIFQSHYAHNTETQLTGFEYLKAIQAAARFSLVSRNASDNSISVHRLVQQVIQDVMPDAIQRQHVSHLAHAIEKCYPRDEFADWVLCRRLDPHARACLTHLDRLGLQLADTALLYKHVAVFMLERFRGPESEEFAQKAVNVATTAKAPATVLADCLHTLGRIQLNVGRTDDAVATHEQAWQLNKAHLSPKHRNIAVSLNNLAMAYKHKRRFAKAAEMYKQSVQILRGSGASERHLLGRALNNLAGHYQEMEKYSDARRLANESIRIKRELPGDHHLDISMTYKLLFSGFAAEQRWEQAEAAMAAAIRELDLSGEPEHPHRYHLFGMYARYLRTRGRAQEAREFEIRMTALKEKGAYQPMPPATSF
jgi:tetratricopeptide (TPR) repeat protein